jgi:hypothetical protein
MIRLVWDNFTIAEWQRLVEKAIQPPISLSWAYAVAQLKTNRWIAHFGLLEVDDEPVAIIQTLEKKALGGLVLTAQCHGGPAWLVENPDPAWGPALLEKLRQRYRTRPFRSFRTYPTAPAMDWPSAGFRRVGAGYQTIWLDIRPPINELHANLRPNWRQPLAKATKCGVTITTDTRGNLLPWLIGHHDRFRRERRFVGPSGQLLWHLHNASYKRGDFLLLRADLPDQPGIAGCLFIRHGRAATWLVGWSDTAGRQCAAQNALIWHAIATLRDKGVEWIDLGGVNPQQSPGLSHFKTGLHPIITEGPGVFI